jgi:hypothetical protein
MVRRMTGSEAQPAEGLTYEALKRKQRKIREGFPDLVRLRVHRALSWLGRAEQESDDPDVRFILLWIGFNAAYAADIGPESEDERRAFATYFAVLVGLDSEQRLFNAVWERFSNEIRGLLRNEYVFAPFWHHKNGREGYDDWAERLASSERRMGKALERRDTACILEILFDRLYVIRCQLVHGAATWKSKANRDQVRDGAAVLGWLLPIFIDIMMDCPDRDWGRPYYPYGG